MTAARHLASLAPTPLASPQPLRQKSLRALATITLGVCGLWAFAPLTLSSSDQTSHASLRPEPDNPAPAARAFDVAAFKAPIWRAPPPPPPQPPPVSQARPQTPAKAPPPPPPPPPLKWQLIAIEDHGNTFRAILYDADVPHLLTVSEGDRLGMRQIATISATTVVVREAGIVRTLMLRDRPTEELR